MATKLNLQMSANGSERTVAAPTPSEPRTKALSGPAKGRNSIGTHGPSLKPANIAVAASKALKRSHDAAAPGNPPPMSLTTRDTEAVQRSTAVVVRELAPRQVRAAVLLVEGRRGKDVADAIGISPETLSRWKHRPEFEALTRELLQQHVDEVRLGMIALTGTAIGQLHNLINSFSDQTSLKACALVLGKVGPVLGVIGTEVRELSATSGE